MVQNNNTATATSGGGIGFLGLLTLILVAAKLFAGANLSWFVCFLPVIIGFGLFLVILAIFVVILILTD